MKATTDILLSIGFVFGLSIIGLGSLATMRPDWSGESALKGGLQREIEDDLTNRLPFSAQAISLWTAAKLATFGQSSDKVVVNEEGWLFTTEEMQAPDTPDFLSEIQNAQQLLAERGIALVLVLVPDKSRVYADLLPRERSAPYRGRYDRALATLSSLGLSVTDLRDVLKNGRADGETYMRTDTHWSPLGAELVANEIAQTLPVKGDSADFITTWLEDAPFSGDLIPFVETGSFRQLAAIQPETINAAETQRAGGADMLFAETETAIALVGTSFSARPEFNFAGFLQQATGLGLVNYATEGQGPFRPMRELLESGAIFETEPKAVIWEIPERYVAPGALR